MNKWICWIFLFLFAFQGISQEQWSLLACIEHARKNNVALQQSKILVDIAEVDLKESKHKLYPDLNAELIGGISFGRNVDPTTNEFTTEDILYSNYSLSSSVILFQGGYVKNSIKQNKLDLQSATKDYQQAENDLALSIASFYLNVLLAQERLLIAEKNGDIVRQQLDQINKLIKAGVKPEADALEVQSQIARSDQTFILAENNLDLAWLTLKQGLRLAPETKMVLEPLTEEQLNDLQIQLYTFDELLTQASNLQPGIQAAKLDLESAKLGEKISRSLYYPSVFLDARIGSRYSDAAFGQEIILKKEELPGVLIDDRSVKFEYLNPSFNSTGVLPFNTQFDQFLGYGAAVVMSIPIYNKYLAGASVQKAKLATKQYELQLELEKEKLGQDIYQAMANVRAAQKELDAANNALRASKSSFEKTQKRFDLGMANVFELNQIQTNFLNAETTYLIAKYDLIFKQKVLDYYAGKQIKL